MKKIVWLLICFALYSFADSELSIKKGWQLVGVPSTVSDMSIFEKDDVELVWAFDAKDQAWVGFSPDITKKQKISQKGYHVLNSINPSHSLWILSKRDWKLKLPQNTTVSNQAQNNQIKLYKGWNLVALPSQMTISPKLFDDEIVWKYDNKKEWQLKDINPFFPPIEHISTGEGIWVKSKTDKSVDISQASSKLHTFDDMDSAKEYIKNMILSKNTTPYWQENFDMVIDEIAMPSQDSQKAVDATETNIQESGVDESDVLKHNGEFIFYIDSKQNSIKITSFSNLVAENYKPIKEIKFDQNLSINSLYLTKDRLIVISNENRYYIARKSMIYPYPQSICKFVISSYNVSDINNIEKISEHIFDGSYFDSRLSDGKLYMISRFYPTSEYLIPFVVDDNGTKETMITAKKFYAPYKLDQSSSITTITKLDALSLNRLDNISFLGDSSTLYASKNALYLSSTQYPIYYDFMHYKEQQAIYKFSLNDSLEYKGRGFVAGRMLNQFSMSEYDDILRVATTSGWSWSGEGTQNSIFTLQEDGDKNLEIIGSLLGLGKKGETIRGVRFIKDRGFVVTFLQTDPFYTIDLSDPKNPTSVGELEIPGFSKYFHPVDDNRILSIGRDADEKGILGGLQIQLFNISDMSKPTLADKVTIGNSGTYSPAEHNHKAFTYRQSDSLFAFSYRDWTNSAYLENLALYKVDGFEIKSLDTIAQSTGNNYWYGESRSVIFDMLTQKYVAYFKGSNIICKPINEE